MENKNENKILSSLEFLKPTSLKRLSKTIIILVETKLWAKVLAGMFLGVILGIFLSESGPLASAILKYKNTINSWMSWLVFPAQFFLKLIKMVIIPLIFSSIIRGLASTDSAEQMKRLGGKFSIFVLFNTILASILGVVLTKIFSPGKGLNLSLSQLAETTSSSDSAVASQSIFSFSPTKILDILPINPLSSLVEGQMLDVVIISLIAGVALLSIQKDQAKGVIDILGVVQQICMTIISWAMKLAPYAVFGMMAQVTSSTGLQALQNMAMYVIVCFFGFIFFIGLYSLMVLIVKKKSPFTYLKILSTPMLLAFSTSSSAATMPISLKIAEDELQINPSAARFLIPLGATVNMAGSAIWQTTAVIFLSQVYNINLNLSQIAIVVATSIASAIGSPGVPGVGIGILASVLVKVGVPIEGVSLIMGVDRIVDMGCTVVNVAGDITAAQIISNDRNSLTKS